MDYDDLFPMDENISLQTINDELIEPEEDYTYMKKKKAVKQINNIQHNNKVGWILRNTGNNKEKPHLEYIEYHKTSYFPGSNIKNAITGQYYDYLVGSNDEKLLFKLIISTGEKGTMVYVNREWIAEPSILFYDSPEECERHLSCEISLKTKRNWLEKRDKYRHEEKQKKANNKSLSRM